MGQVNDCSARTHRQIKRPAICIAVIALALLCSTSLATAAITSAGDILPVPPAGGGNVVGPFEIGNVDVGTMNIAGGTMLTNTMPAVIGDTLTGLGIVTMSGFGSDWTLTSAGADLTVGNNGTGSISLANLAFLSVNDDLFMAAQLDALGEMSISGLGTIVDVGDDANIGQRGQAVVSISDGGRLVTDANIIGDEPASDGRVILSDQFSLWRGTSSMVIADAGRALLQVFDGARVENTVGTVGNLAGSTGTAEIVGLGSLWDISSGLAIGEAGTGSLIIADGGRVNSGSATSLTTLGNQAAGNGRAEVRGADSLWAVGGTLEVGNSGTGTLRILEGGRVTSGNVLIGDNVTARGSALVDGAGSTWEITGELTISDPGEGHLAISNGGLVRSSSLTRVAARGRLTLDGGRLESGMTTGLLNTGVVDGNGTIEILIANNNAGGQIRPQGPEPLVITGALNNSGLIDVQSGVFEVLGPTTNNLDIDARDGAILRFRGTGLINVSGAQLAITTGIVDVFGLVDNNVGAEIAVGGTAVAVFHDAVTNNGTIFVQPGGEVLMLENLGFGAGSSLSIQLREIDLLDPDTELSDAWGQVQVASSATLAGTLEVELVGGYMPLAGDLFQILTAGGGRSGIFSSEILPSLSGGLNWDVEYNPNSVVLAVVAPVLAGDYNQNGVVDAADYVLWRDTLGQMGAGLAADGNANGQIDPDDYQVWRANFGRTAGSGAMAGSSNTAAIPEPATFILLACSALGTIFRLRRGNCEPVAGAD